MKRLTFPWIAAVLVFIAQLSGTTLADTTAQTVPTEKKMSLEGHTIFYTDIGQGTPIILVHGLFANKEQWQSLQQQLAQRHFRVIALDLAGFGKSLGFPFQNYDLKQQVDLLHRFVTRLDVKKFNLAGSSMGGAIATLYTLKYPNDVLSLAYIGSPLGTQPPTSSETNQLFEKGIDPFVPTTKQDAQRLLHLIFANPPSLSDTELDAMVKNNVKNKAEREKIVLVALNPYRKILTHPLNIQKPVLILWGNQDRTFDVSGAYVLHKYLPTSQLIVLKQTGHLPQVECAKTTAQVYLEFLTHLTSKDKPENALREIACPA